MAQVTLQELTEAGEVVATQAIDTSDLVKNANGDSFIYLDNSGGSAAACTVTITSQRPTFNDSAYGLSSKADVVISLVANDVKISGKYAKVPFNNATGDLVISYSGDTAGLTIGAFRGNY